MAVDAQRGIGQSEGHRHQRSTRAEGLCYRCVCCSVCPEELSAWLNVLRVCSCRQLGNARQQVSACPALPHRCSQASVAELQP